MRDDAEADEPGRVLRPEATVLPDEALIPPTRVIQPPPNRFTHRLAVDEPYRFGGSSPGDEPDGVLAAGTTVVLLVGGKERCRVVDPDGRYVEVRAASLRPLDR